MGGGGQDPKKPGTNKPSRDHYEEAATPPAWKAARKQAKKDRERKRRAARSERQRPDNDVEMEPEASSPVRDEVVVRFEDDEVEFVFSRPHSNKLNRLLRFRYQY